MRHEAGFTLVELLVVMMVIGVLIGVETPNMIQIRNQANKTAVMLNMRTVAQVIEMFNAENGYYASDFYEDGYGYLFPGGTKTSNSATSRPTPTPAKKWSPMR